MIHWIIYDAREAASGFDLYERSAGFPAEARQEIKELCKVINSENNREDAINLRYLPLERGSYLLSVIFRAPTGSQYSVRSTHRVVNFLLGSASADELFRSSFVRKAQWLIAQATTILRKPDSGIVVDFADMAAMPEVELNNLTSPATLLGAASYCENGMNLDHQAYIGLPPTCPREQPLMEIGKMLSLLPFALRKKVSFQTWIHSVVESERVALNIGSVQRITAFVGSGYTGGPRSNKHAYYPGSNIENVSKDSGTNALFAGMELFVHTAPYAQLLLEGIQDWETYRDLNGLLKQKSAGSRIVSLLPQMTWVQLLMRKRQNEKVLKALKADCPKSREYKRLRQELDRQLENSAANRDGCEQTEKGRKKETQVSRQTGEPAPAPRKSRDGTWSTLCSKLLIGLGGCLFTLFMLWLALEKLLNVYVLKGDVALSITISLSDGIELVRTVAAFFLGVLTTLLISYCVRVLRSIWRKK